MERDRRGRQRRAGQERGLRPLHPLLPSHWESKAVRVAMSHEDWDRFEDLVSAVLAQTQTPTSTQARAHGLVISKLLETASQGRPAVGRLDWLDWERQKTLRLLRAAV